VVCCRIYECYQSMDFHTLIIERVPHHSLLFKVLDLEVDFVGANSLFNARAATQRNLLDNFKDIKGRNMFIDIVFVRPTFPSKGST
jgi:hypothetical protein